MTSDAPLLITDSCCDLPPLLAEKLDLEVLPFPFTIDGTAHLDDLGRTMPHAAFYAAMREGAAPTTAQVAIASYLTVFRAAAESGRDAVFLGFSSALSGSYDSALVARQTVLAEHPDARILAVDTRRASIAEGLIVIEAARQRDAGASADDIATWAEGARGLAYGVFTLESLEHLRRGGRIGDVTAAAGAMLDVRPLLGFTENGELSLSRAVRGRKKSLRAITDTVAELSGGRCEMLVLGHADAAEDASVLEVQIRERVEVGEVVLCDVGPVIGSHTGPGMVAASFWRNGPVE